MRLRPFIAPTAREEAKAKSFDAIEDKYGYPERLLDVMWFHESTRGKQTLSSAGATTDFQFMPATAKEIYDKHGIDVTKGTQYAAMGAAAYIDDIGKIYKFNLFESVCAYNCGPGRVKRLKAQYGDDWFEHAPNHTKAYAEAIFKELGYDKEEALALERKPRESKLELLAKQSNAIKVNHMAEATKPLADSTRVAPVDIHQIVADTTKWMSQNLYITFTGEADHNMVERPLVRKRDADIAQLFKKEPVLTK